MHDIALRLFLGQGIFPTLHYFCRTPDIATAAAGIIFNVFSYGAVLGQDSKLLPSRQRADALRVIPEW